MPSADTTATVESVCVHTLLSRHAAPLHLLLLDAAICKILICDLLRSSGRFHRNVLQYSFMEG
jgi:hypothetical protein